MAELKLKTKKKNTIEFLPKYMRLLQNAPKGTPVPPYMMMILPDNVTELDANSCGTSLHKIIFHSPKSKQYFQSSRIADDTR